MLRFEFRPNRPNSVEMHPICTFAIQKVHPLFQFLFKNLSRELYLKLQRHYHLLLAMQDESLTLTFQVSDIEEIRDSVESLNMARIEESRISSQFEMILSDDEDDVTPQKQSNASANYEPSYDVKTVKLTKSQKHNRKMKRKRQREALLNPKPIFNLPRSEEYEGMSKT